MVLHKPCATVNVARWSRRGRVECKPTACTSLVLLTIILFVSHHVLVARCIVDVQRHNHAVLYRLHRRSSHLVCYCLHGRAGCSYIHRTSTFSITMDLFRFASTSVYYRHDKMRSFVVLCGPLRYLVIPKYRNTGEIKMRPCQNCNKYHFTNIKNTI